MSPVQVTFDNYRDNGVGTYLLFRFGATFLSFKIILGINLATYFVCVLCVCECASMFTHAHCVYLLLHIEVKGQHEGVGLWWTQVVGLSGKHLYLSHPAIL